MSIISKELLSAVLNENIDEVLNIQNNILNIRYGTFVDEINIYELSHKCKEWALSRGYHIWSMQSNGFSDVELFYNSFSGIPTKQFSADTEPEAIIKACEWILSQGKE